MFQQVDATQPTYELKPVFSTLTNASRCEIQLTSHQTGVIDVNCVL